MFCAVLILLSSSKGKVGEDLEVDKFEQNVTRRKHNEVSSYEQIQCLDALAQYLDEIDRKTRRRIVCESLASIERQHRFEFLSVQDQTDINITHADSFLTHLGTLAEIFDHTANGNDGNLRGGEIL